ncbi:MAG: ornithine carbamoyltransferase [Candidatus Hodarchaeota archaeon]
MQNIRGKDFLTLQDFTPHEISLMLDTASDLKRETAREAVHRLIQGKNLAMIFQKPSTRTRVSFEVAMNQLGGYSIYLGWNDIHLGRGEPISDTAQVLNRYVDGIMARVFSHDNLEELAENAKIPVINGLSDLFHPCQILGDLLTIREKRGDLDGLSLAFVGDGNNVCNSLLIGCSKMGIDICVGTPKGYEPTQSVVSLAKKNSTNSGSRIEISNSPEKAVKDADIVYTDVWISMGQEKESEKRKKDFSSFQVTEKLCSVAYENYLFMHCLPREKHEVTDEVFYGPHSIVWDQAENRLHAQKALLVLLL